MQIPLELLPVVQITLPVLFGMFLATFAVIWSQNKAFELQNKRLDDIIARLGRIENILKEQGERITRLEERIPPLVHR
jgi:hypothetical protein